MRGESQIGLSGEKYDASVFASWSQGDDYTTGNGETVQSDFTRGSFGANIGMKLASNQQLRIAALYNRARDADFPALAMDLREDDTWMFNARHDIQFGGKILQSWNTSLFGSFVNHLMDNLLKPLNPRTMNAENFATTFNYGGRTEGGWKWSKGTLYAGADLRIEGAEGTRVRSFLMGPMAGKTAEDNAWQDAHISKTGFFAEYQIKRHAFDYIVSARMEFNNANINKPAQEYANVYDIAQVTQVNPGISVGLLKDLGNNVQTGLWLARVQRSGSLTERFINYFPVGQDPYELLGNPQLKPEVNYQADLTLKWLTSKSAVVQVDLFASYLQDYISSVIAPDLSPRLPTSPGVRQFVNIAEAVKTGFEVSWTQQLFTGVSHRMGIAYTYGQDMEREEALPEIAPLDLRYSLYGAYLKGRLKPEISLRYVAKQSRVSAEFGETTTPAFTLLDFKVGYQVLQSLSFNAGINNLLDELYYEHLSRSVRVANIPIYAPGRNVFANLTWRF